MSPRLNFPTIPESTISVVNRLKVYIKGEKTLFLFVTGQPEYELIAVKPHEFKIKSLEGFTIKFEVDGSGKAAEIISVQPNGTFRAKRK